MKHKSFALTTQHKIMSEDKTSLFPSFPLEDFEKEVAEVASVVLRF